MNAKILIVEDDAIISSTLRLIIERFGWVCIGECSDAESVLRIVDKEKPDIVLMDVTLHGMIDGIDAAEILKSRFGIHVIFITAYSNPETVNRIRSSQPYGYVLKPFRDEDIFTAVTVALVIREMEQKLKEKDERLAAALSAARVGTWREDNVAGGILLDETICTLIGRDPSLPFITVEEIIACMHPEDRELALTEARRAHSEGSDFEIDIRFVRPDGVIKWVRDRGICFIEHDEKSRYLTGAMVDITERKQLEEKLLNISEAHRQEIGQLIHDELGQQLTGLSFLAESLFGSLKEKGLEAEAVKARTIADRTYGALDDVRRIARSFYPVQINASGFEDALLSLASDAQALSGIRCTCENNAGMIRFDNTRATQIYYIIREAVNNSIKHSHATEILIGISRVKRYVVISIIDNGQGFNPVADGKGIGLNIMEFRANLFKGTLSVNSKPGGGAAVTLTVLEME